MYPSGPGRSAGLSDGPGRSAWSVLGEMERLWDVATQSEVTSAGLSGPGRSAGLSDGDLPRRRRLPPYALPRHSADCGAGGGRPVDTAAPGAAGDGTAEVDPEREGWWTAPGWTAASAAAVAGGSDDSRGAARWGPDGGSSRGPGAGSAASASGTPAPLEFLAGPELAMLPAVEEGPSQDGCAEAAAAGVAAAAAVLNAAESRRRAAQQAMQNWDQSTWPAIARWLGRAGPQPTHGGPSADRAATEAPTSTGVPAEPGCPAVQGGVTAGTTELAPLLPLWTRRECVCALGAGTACAVDGWTPPTLLAMWPHGLW